MTSNLIARVWPMVLIACSSTANPIVERHASELPTGVVATVGASSVTRDAIVEVARTQHVTPADALSREIHDALYAEAALARGYAESPAVGVALRGVLARARLAQLQAEALRGAILDSEIVEATARHFVELDRPETFRVIHAVVRLDDSADSAKRARARSLATRVSERVKSAVSADDFRTRAEGTDDRGDLEITVEALEPVAADGRTLNLEYAAPGTTYSPAFARAASRLVEPGEKSPIVETEFGFHVLMLLERLPAHVVPLSDRKRILREEIVTERAKRSKQNLLAELRRITPPEVERSAEALLASLPVLVDEVP